MRVRVRRRGRTHIRASRHAPTPARRPDARTTASSLAGSLSPPLQTLAARLGAHAKPERDAGIAMLQALLADAPEPAQLRAVRCMILDHLVGPAADGASAMDGDAALGGLLAAHIMLTAGSGAAVADRSGADASFARDILPRAVTLLDAGEPRVRAAAGRAAAAACRLLGVGPETQMLQDALLARLRAGLRPGGEAGSAKRDASAADDAAAVAPCALGPGERAAVADAQRDAERGDNGAGNAHGSGCVHGAKAWTALETAFTCLREIAESCGPALCPLITDELLGCVYNGMLHENQFVREASFSLGAACVSCCAAERDASGGAHDELLRRIAVHLVPGLARGLVDTCFPVRLAASVATRMLFVSGVPHREQYYRQLAPAMAMNRYCYAEGVRVYSQETWRLVMGESGREIITRYLCDTVDLYIAEAHSANRVAHEAACVCIAELGSKLDPARVAAYADRLLPTLTACLDDDPWAVRDAACAAIGRFVAGVPAACRARLPELCDALLGALSDAVWAVRESAAQALGLVARTYGDDAVQRLMAESTARLQMIRCQLATPDVVPAATAAPTRPPPPVRPDEKAPRQRLEDAYEGCAYLVRELCQVAASSPKLPELMTSVCGAPDAGVAGARAGFPGPHANQAAHRAVRRDCGPWCGYWQQAVRADTMAALARHGSESGRAGLQAPTRWLSRRALCRHYGRRRCTCCSCARHYCGIEPHCGPSHVSRPCDCTRCCSRANLGDPSAAAWAHLMDEHTAGDVTVCTTTTGAAMEPR